ncbi:carbohydrate sulfotransferase 8 [Oxyura jamaicensis]|nr:carbohydrate sulfotransferase 8 [Oxyura jamaicensis]XP_035193064.1 carbohydrate sulfotransferase 8 [Oxyura jamaicensis]XP_035193065.1 carbohydrate sulfotransferase 8 [Oxyura jamaicensis]XP_035193066.1 carbohydrate sulfotransferase 8 [Oxyura jamaicensis]
MRLTCMFSFILLFGAAGLIVFIHLQDPEEIVHQQTPGIKYNMGFQQPKKDCVSSNNRERRLRKNTADGIATVKLRGSLHPAENVPTKLQSTDRQQSSITFGKDYQQQGEEINSIRLHKRRRRFVIKKSPILISMNSSTFNLPTLKSEDRSNSKWKSLYQIQSKRKQIMRETCSKYKSNNRRIITPYHVSRIFVEDKYRVLYCEVPKAGCSNWKRVLMVLNGLAASTKDIQHNTVHYGNYLKRLDGFDRKGIYHRLNTYTKMLFIREPFEKLVSAFRDKFEHPNNYYHPVFGKAIISRYRVNATKEALRTGSGVKFKEFIQYLLDVHRPVGMDIHWDHVNRLCSPCLIDYDFVGKFESMEEDANFFLHLIGAPQNLTFPKFKDRHSNEERTTTKITQQYFAQLSPSQRQRSYDFYYMDYLMFNYSKPFEDLY